MLKIFVAYLNEGVKIYFRFSYGICYMLKETIVLNTDKNSMNSLIQNAAQGFSLINSHQLLRVSYTLILTKMKESFMKAERKQRMVLVMNFFI